MVPPPPGFLQAIESLARERGIVFIVDGCLMFRLVPDRSSEFFGLQLDMIMLGKFIGGGSRWAPSAGTVCASG